MAKTPISELIAELRAMSVPELVERYGDVFGNPPRVKHREHLWRRIAWKIQEQRYGGLSTVAKRRLDGLIADLDIPLQAGPDAVGKVAGKALIGTTVTRTWKGHEVAATRVDAGWEHDGVVHRSLTAVAESVTGSHWSGPAFFGLTKRETGR